MNALSPRNALFHPFHLCAPHTLEALLARYDAVHFRDYMALRLTPLMGTTAYQAVPYTHLTLPTIHTL